MISVYSRAFAILISILLLTRGVFAIDDSRRNAIVNAVEKASPAIVNISTTQIQEFETIDPFFDDFFDLPFRIPRRRELHGLGSGVIIDRDGHILTNQHVIENADFVKVILSDGREFEAEIIGLDFHSDLAVLKIENVTNLKPITFGNSDDLMIGEWSIAIGHPFASAVDNPKPTVTVGVVSAVDRSLKTRERRYRDLIQTDASINPGNSGGALVNSHGDLIGINTAIYTTSGGSQGIGFAVPVNVAKRVIDLLIENGMIIPPKIGLSVQDLTSHLAEEMKVGDRIGALIAGVEKGSIAEKSGLKRGDLITEIDGRSVIDQFGFHAITRLLKVGEKTEISIVRKGKLKNLSITIRDLEWTYEISGWGLTVKQLKKSERDRYLHDGVLVAEVDRKSELYKKELKSGDLIYRIGNVEMRTLEDFKQLIPRLHNQRFSVFFERDREEWVIRNLIVR